MKKKILSTSLGLVLTVALFLPTGYSTARADGLVLVPVNVNCITIKTEGAKLKVCDGGLQKLDVSWNSGGG